MNCCEFDYQIKTASCEEIIDHLIKCADRFTPPLHAYVDIEKYGNKIFDNAITFEAWDENKLVGLVAIYYNDHETKIGFITNVSVLERYQGCGIASKLLIQAIDYGKENDFNRIELEVSVQNMKAIKLYKKHGFKVTERNKNNCMLMKLTTTPHSNDNE